MKIQNLVEQLLQTLVFAVVICNKSSLKEVSFSEGSGKVLNIIVNVGLPDIEEGHFFFKDELLKFVHHKFDFKGFSVVNKRSESLKVSSKGGVLSQGTDLLF